MRRTGDGDGNQAVDPRRNVAVDWSRFDILDDAGRQEEARLGGLCPAGHLRRRIRPGVKCEAD